MTCELLLFFFFLLLLLFATSDSGDRVKGVGFNDFDLLSNFKLSEAVVSGK